jgi:LmbE family N-acetylglucosaminyl deacetylase
MQLSRPTAEVFVPDELVPTKALARTTHLCVAAHSDDIEIMAVSGVLECFQHDDRWFTGVVVTDGAGSPRDGLYAGMTDEGMRLVRRKEQRKAAVVGEYAAQVLLDHPSAVIKDPQATTVVDDLMRVIQATRPETIFTHNLADKHDTHVAVALRLIAALRRIPPDARPGRLFGCEVWRDLDWLPEDEKVAFDVSRHEGLQAALLGIFDSQVAAGKRYDLATLGRRRAHATYHVSHATDTASGLVFAADLTPLIADSPPDITAFVRSQIDRFSADVTRRLSRLG